MDHSDIMGLIIFVIMVNGPYLIVCYLIGSIPTGYWLAKILKGIDIRTVGSGSTGATNVYRSVGKVAGISVFLVDFCKGYLPVLLANWYFLQYTNSNILYYVPNTHHLLPVLAAVAALIGHSRSIFLGFKGGKSAATGLGTLFALDFRVGLLTFLFWMIVLYIGKMVSVASILATAVCIPLMIFLHPIPSYVIYCIFGFIYVTARHRANIGRIMAGTEPKIGGQAN